MKFINYMEKISGVSVYGLASLTIFVVFFTAMLIWVLKTKKKTFTEISRIPLDN